MFKVEAGSPPVVADAVDFVMDHPRLARFEVRSSLLWVIRLVTTNAEVDLLQIPGLNAILSVRNGPVPFARARSNFQPWVLHIFLHDH